MGNARIKAPKGIFLPFQQKWIDDHSLYKIAEKSRQIGFTWCTAYSDLTVTAMQDNRHDLWITSTDELQAKLYIQDCLGWAGVLQVAAADMGEQILYDPDGKKHAAQVLRCSNGRNIYSLSSNFNAQAGKRGNRRADEFALNKNNRQLYGIMQPGTQWGGTIWIWSTHRGDRNYFNELITEIREGGNPKGFSLHRITLEDALDQGLLDKLQSKWDPADPRQAWDEAEFFNATRARCPDEETFLQEYMCVPSSDASSYIGYDLIDNCTYLPNAPWEHVELNPEAEYYLGYDVGRKHDLSVLYLVQATGDYRYTRRIVELPRTTFTQQQEILYGFLARPEIRRACIDATGLGAQLAEQARERFGYKVEEVVFNSRVKEDLAVTLRRAMEDRKFLIPNDRTLIADIRSIRKETTSAGNIRYQGDRTEDGHADRFWAAALALHAAKTPSLIYAPVPVAVYGNNPSSRHDAYALPNNITLTSRPF